ncbi:MAG: TonB-dependent receptor [Bacteroidota bacterium]
MKNLFFILIFLFLVSYGFSQKKEQVSVYDYSLKDLSELTAVTGSFDKKRSNISPTNVTIITEQMIEERGYQTLVDVCQDIPDFDFMMYNEGGGEYPGYSKNRGLGEVGNPEILIMINGILQNNISFNWSTMWTYENMFIDVKQIEIVQGPGSVMYGAQAFTGVINIITKKKYEGLKAISTYGSLNTWKNDLHYGMNFNRNVHFSLALHQYHSTGDMGLNRYDPGGYFTNNQYPDTILADYDSEGNYIQNIPNPLAGKYIPDGFNTMNNSFALRTALSYKNSTLGFFYSDSKRGNSSFIVPYEYFLADKENLAHYRYINVFFESNAQVTSKVKLNSQVVLRTSDILPITGFKYLYQFPELTKNNTSYAYQFYLEEKLSYQHTAGSSFYLGFKSAFSRKSDRIISLGVYDYSRTGTSSSWFMAHNGDGINMPGGATRFYENETAVYGLWDKEWFLNFNTSIGLRYDYSTDFGNILNPRFSIMFNPKPALGLKVVYGTAFRQAGAFEMYSEFRGNPDLVPERIATGEFELSSFLINESLLIKANIFHSNVSQYIGKVPDSSMPAGERFENQETIKIVGASAKVSMQINEKIRFYSNYYYISGLRDGFKLYEIDNVARGKINAGVNTRFIDNKLITDFRINYVAKRKAKDTNTWIHTYENGYAPSYLKANLTTTYRLNDQFSFQLIVNNIFNKGYYGLGRETGNGFIDDYDPLFNPNPLGHIPAYHPQPGRTFLGNIIFKLK